jgi:hypothetical protein
MPTQLGGLDGKLAGKAVIALRELNPTNKPEA